MAINYIVVLDTTPVRNDFRPNYFPRGFHYRREADDMVQEVVEKGGTAHVVPKSQATYQLLLKVRG